MEHYCTKQYDSVGKLNWKLPVCIEVLPVKIRIKKKNEQQLYATAAVAEAAAVPYSAIKMYNKKLLLSEEQNCGKNYYSLCVCFMNDVSEMFIF